MGTNEGAFLTHPLARFNERTRERSPTTAFKVQKASANAQTIAGDDTLKP